MGGKGSGKYPRTSEKQKQNVLKAQAASPFRTQKASDCDPDVNARSIEFARRLMDFGPLDLSDAEAVMARFDEYMAMCREMGMKPQVMGATMALNLRNKGDLRLIAMGDPATVKRLKVTPESLVCFQKFYQFLEATWELNLAGETGNPVKWIFFGKNHFGYRDQTETVSYHVDAAPPELDAAEVAKRYIEQVGGEALPSGEVEVEAEVQELLPEPGAQAE